jgi:uncharacterized protein GlcG (DUF336 family)
MAPAPPASHQFEHEWALSLADAVIREASRRGARVAIAIVDHRGDAIQQDAMDGAPTTAAFFALSLAATAATFQDTSAAVGEKFVNDLVGLRASLPFDIATAPGGIPIVEDGRFVGGLGVAGPPPAEGASIAKAALESIS